MNRNLRLAIVAVVVIAVVGVVLSQFASTKPDGLEFVAEREGFAGAAEDHSLDDTPLAGYGDDGSSRAIAAGVGIVITLGLGYGLFKILGRSNSEHPPVRD
ncbi:MAG: PDGLE domain-containing protein [Acidimicrobiia bacterium]|nr:PDGLE domain-containing protein [Acidimicrobiia bacterium]